MIDSLRYKLFKLQQLCYHSMKIVRKKTKDLSKDLIDKICQLKDTYWTHGLKSNRKWFKKFVKTNVFVNVLVSIRTPHKKSLD